MPMLNYRAFEATIVLQSYRDKLIDMFDSKALIQRLYLEADKREMIRCGAGLCFTRGLSVKGSHCEFEQADSETTLTSIDPRLTISDYL